MILHLSCREEERDIKASSVPVSLGEVARRLRVDYVEHQYFVTGVPQESHRIDVVEVLGSIRNKACLHFCI